MDVTTTLLCPSCSATVPEGSRFCQSCGTAVPAVPTEPAIARQVASAPTLPNPALDPRGAGHEPPKPHSQRKTALNTSADPLIGQVIADRYKILAMLGRGGMGVVYKVEHVHIGKLMAMKLLSGELASDPNTVRRFRREAKAISKLVHPNTVQIFDFGQSANLAYLVMEYLPGKDFASVIAEEFPLSFTRVAKICAQVAASVSEAHERGIIHRDIKPENVMVVEAAGQRDLVKVLDFGIAKLRDSTDEGGVATQSGHLVGTPYYMAPEQIRAEPYDHRVDVYALGAMMYKALAGQPPFTADTPMGVLTMHLTATLVPVRKRAARADLPEVADTIIARAMQKDPDKRYARMDDLRADLLAYLASVGELDTTDNLVMRSRSLNLERSDSLSAELATRGDVDRYEGRLRRTSWLGSALGVVAVAGFLFAGYQLWGQRIQKVELVEQEPNDEPATANPLSVDAGLRGYLGKRQSITYGDADVYSFEIPLEETRVARLSVTALPNMDVVIDLVRKGESRPLLLADTGRLAEPEIVPNFGLRGGTYYLRVREVWESGRMPTENVSDPYTVSLRFEKRGSADEAEPNDTFDTAEKVERPEPRRGYLGWAGDQDVYCIAPSLLPIQVSLEAMPTLDTVLRLVNRSSDTSRVIDDHGAAEGESVDIENSPNAEPCVQISVREDPDAPRGDAEHPYTLKILRL